MREWFYEWFTPKKLLWMRSKESDRLIFGRGFETNVYCFWINVFHFLYLYCSRERPPFLEASKRYWGTFVFWFYSWEQIWLNKSKAIIGTFMYILMLDWKDLKYYVSIYVCVYMCPRMYVRVRTHKRTCTHTWLLFICKVLSSFS